MRSIQREEGQWLLDGVHGSDNDSSGSGSGDSPHAYGRGGGEGGEGGGEGSGGSGGRGCDDDSGSSDTHTSKGDATISATTPPTPISRLLSVSPRIPLLRVESMSNPQSNGASVIPLVFSPRSPRLRALLDRVLHKLISTQGQGLHSLHSKVACACVDLLCDPHVLQTLILYQSNAQSNAQSNVLRATREMNSNGEHPPLALASLLSHHRWSDGWRQRLFQGSP